MKDGARVLFEQHVSPDLAEVSRKTGLVVRSDDSAAVTSLFAELERYDEQECLRCISRVFDKYGSSVMQLTNR